MKLRYRYHLDITAIILFVAIMLPNILWALFPVPNDVLRVNSITPVVDIIGSVAQVLMIASLILLIRDNAPKIMAPAWKWITVCCAVIYLSCWVLYFFGHVNIPIILAMTIIPCGAFMSYAKGKRNYLALGFAAIFFVCHLVFSIKNFC